MMMKMYFWLFLLTGPALICACQPQQNTGEVRRYGQVIKVKPDKIDEYKQLHADPWPCVMNKLDECNISNYSIFLRDNLLFAYFEYTGIDFEADMKKMAGDSCTQKWWSYTDPCQMPLESATEGEWWVNMEEVFHKQ